MTGRATCYRLSGGGNDFLALAEPAKPPSGAQIRAWCTRGLSLGADGVFVLTREDAAVRMDYFNADGIAAELCLNGARCAARLVLELGWMESPFAIATGAGEILAADAGRGAIRLDLSPPVETPEARRVTVGDSEYAGWFLTVGVPQFVVAWPTSLATAPVGELGPALRGHPAFGESGTNVMFVRFLAPDRLEIRSFERGVEAETLACGTGVLAASAVAVAEAALEPPIRALTGGGCELEVDGTVEDGRWIAWSLTGDARLLARLEVDPDAERLPQPPTWSPTPTE